MNYTYNNETLYHHGIPGQKWGIRRFQNPDGTLTEEGLKRKHDKAHKIEIGLNKASKREAVFTSAYKNAKYEADKYRSESKANPAKNVFYGLGRKYIQHMLDQKVKEWASYSKMGQNEVKRYMHKVGKDPDLEMAVLLGAIWGLPYDVYAVGVKDKKS